MPLIQTGPEVSGRIEGDRKHRIVTQAVVLIEIFQLHGAAIHQYQSFMNGSQGNLIILLATQRLHSHA